MRKIIIFLILAIGAISGLATINSDSGPMKKLADGTYVVNTTTLCNKKGFRDVTPLEVYIKAGKVMRVVPLKNSESPSYFQKVKAHLLPLFSDIKISQAKKISSGDIPDACTGATYSTRAAQANIAKALEYYQAHK